MKKKYESIKLRLNVICLLIKCDVNTENYLHMITSR